MSLVPPAAIGFPQSVTCPLYVSGIAQLVSVVSSHLLSASPVLPISSRLEAAFVVSQGGESAEKETCNGSQHSLSETFIYELPLGFLSTVEIKSMGPFIICLGLTRITTAVDLSVSRDPRYG